MDLKVLFRVEPTRFDCYGAHWCALTVKSMHTKLKTWRYVMFVLVMVLGSWAPSQTGLARHEAEQDIRENCGYEFLWDKPCWEQCSPSFPHVILNMYDFVHLQGHKIKWNQIIINQRTNEVRHKLMLKSVYVCIDQYLIWKWIKA